MKKKLSESLAQLLTSEDPFDNPYEEGSTPHRSQKEFIVKQKEKKKEKKSKKKDPFEELVSEVEDVIMEDEDEEDGKLDFDEYLEDFILEDEDDNFRNDLIKQGRKYTRSTLTSKESSEIQKVYAGSEERIEHLLIDIEEDSRKLQDDITHLRMTRSRNYKALSDMIEQRRGYHDSTLRAIQELNKMTKDKIELQLKVDREHKDENSDGDIIATKAIQNIFGMGRGNLIGSYADMSGSKEAGQPIEAGTIDEDALIEKKYFPEDEDEPETDGDKFLKYEDRIVELILEIDDEGHPIDIVAEDQDGNVLPDYPTVDIADDLTFNISETTGTATDNLSQRYKVRRI